MTGYRIHYQTEGDRRSVDVGASATQHALTGLYGGRNYSIYLVALSAQLPSPIVGPAVVKLGGELARHTTMLCCVSLCHFNYIYQVHVLHKLSTLQSCMFCVSIIRIIFCHFNTAITDHPIVTTSCSTISSSTTSPHVTATPAVTTDTKNTTDSMFSTTSTPDSTRVLTEAVVAGIVGGAILLGLLVLVTCIYLILHGR